MDVELIIVGVAVLAAALAMTRRAVGKVRALRGECSATSSVCVEGCEGCGPTPPNANSAAPVRGVDEDR